MKRSILIFLLSAVFVMLVLPWAAVAFLPSEAGMAASLFLFFLADPLYCILAGIWAGRTAKVLWPAAPVCAALYWLGAQLILGSGDFDPAFIGYAAIYGILSAASIWISRYLHRKSC